MLTWLCLPPTMTTEAARAEYWWRYHCAPARVRRGRDWVRVGPVPRELVDVSQVARFRALEQESALAENDGQALELSETHDED